MFRSATVRLAPVFLAICLLSMSPMEAGALTMTPNPITYTDGETSVTITLVGTAIGIPGGGTVLMGSTGLTDLSLVFSLSVSDVDPFDLVTAGIEKVEVGVRVPPFTLIASTGAGWIPGAGVDIAQVTGTVNARSFDFGLLTPPNNDAVLAGQTSDLFFVSYAAGVLQSNGTQVVRLKLDPVVGGIFGGPPDPTLIPEPGSLLLLGMGLGFLGTRAARRRKA